MSLPDDLDPRRVTWGDPAPSRANAATFVTVAGVLGDVLDDELPAEPSLGGELDTQPGDLALTDAPPLLVADRYERRQPLGSGGMGEVWRVHDRLLRRTVALKLIRGKLVGQEVLARFEEEAQVSAQLQHPGIIPVHDYGQLDDGRVWFTMKEVRGRTLEQQLQEVHRAWRLGMNVSESGFTFRRLLESFLRVTETVAYAHSRGVVHRDIKPSNIMLGGYGEVLVLDWGLAKVVGTGSGSDDDGDDAGVDLASAGVRTTMLGAITGTPAYMSPEQARGESADCGPAADVYSLGATLYDLLCERPPRLASTPRRLVLQVAMGKAFRPPSEVAEGPEIDDELERICLKALQTEVDDRYADAAALAADLAQWLDDARKRERAMAFVHASARFMAEADRAEHDAVEQAARAEAALAEVADNAPVPDKLAGWALEDEATALEEAARTARTQGVQQLRSALSHAPDLREAHDALADHFRRVHERLETTSRDAEARQVARDLALHDRSGRYAAYLKGTGALTLRTDPEGAEVRLHRYELQERRLVPVFDRSLGRTPLVEVPLEMGSYLLTIHAEGHDVVRYPVYVERQEHWHGVPPGATEPLPIRLPREGELGPDEIYVPAGWFWWGQDARGSTTEAFERRWCDGFTVGRHPVTVGEYSAWLNRLLDAGDEALADELQPRTGDDHKPILARDAGGRFGSINNQEPGWEHISSSPRMPVLYVPFHHAQRYAAAHDARLPSADQWVKAARGADRRAYAWGDHFDPTWCQNRYAERIEVVPVDRYATDRSPYEMFGACGNVAEWGVDDGLFHMGGHCGNGPWGCVVTFRVPAREEGLSFIGFRVVRDRLS